MASDNGWIAESVNTANFTSKIKDIDTSDIYWGMKDRIRDRRNQLRIAVAKRINSQVTVLTEDRKQKQIQVCRVLSCYFKVTDSKDDDNITL